MEIIFNNQIYLLFLFSLPLLIIFHYINLRRVKGRVLQFANFVAMARVSTPEAQPRNILQLVLRLLTLSFIILAVAGMGINYVGMGTDSDYAVAIDVSSSMSSTDISPTRLDAAKMSAIEFASIVPEKTKIGLVSFSGTSFVEQTLTKDKDLIKEKINNLELSYVGGTDLGEAIISSANLVLPSENSKTIILLTDGKSNIGVGTARAIDYANTNNIQIFTIGVGTLEGGSPEGTNVSLTLDENLLKRIAELTSGEYIYAETKEEISSAYRKIITQTKKKYSFNVTLPLMFLVLICSFIDWMLLNTKYRRIP